MATELNSPMVGKVVSVLVKEGDRVEADKPVFVLEAMKMNIDVVAPASGTVKDLKIKPGDAVVAGQLICTIE